MILRIGHRGAAGHEPENTLRSFRRALGIGVDMIEFDVHICASGEIVVIHDKTVERTSNGTGYVNDLTYQELRKLDAGLGERIRTLEEAFDLALGCSMLNIELKGDGTGRPVLRSVEHYIETGKAKSNDFLVTSFKFEELVALRELSDTIRIGILTSGNPEDVLEIARDLNAHSVNPHHSTVGERFVEESHERGLMIYPWTVNEKDVIAKMKYLKVDGIISDYPDRI